MSTEPKLQPESLQATLTAGLGAAATTTCLKWLPPEDAQYWVGICTFVVPGVVYFCIKWFSALDEPAELIRYKAHLKKDIAHQKKILKDKHASEVLKAAIRLKYDETILKLSCANQDYSSKGIVIDADAS